MSTDLVGSWNNTAAQDNAAPWEKITDGEHVGTLKEATLEQGNSGPFIQYKLYYPQFNCSEDTRNYLSGNAVGVKVAKQNLAVIDAKLNDAFDTDEDLLNAITKSLAAAVGGKIKFTRKSKAGDGEKVYRNFYFTEFNEIPF